MPIPTELFATIMEHFAADSVSNTPAAGAVRVWHTLFRTIAPLLGPPSADLLFARSLATNEAAFPWLPHIPPGAARTAFAEFERSLESRSAEEIAAANRALLSTYTTVLAELIGMRLATKFLGASFSDDKTNKNT